MGVRETALNALQTVLEALEDTDEVETPPTVAPRNSTEPETVGAGGLLILRDGEAGDPVEVLLSPTTYCYEHRAEVEVWVQGADAAARDAALDAILELIPPLIDADRTLTGTVDFTQVGEPDLDTDRFPGAGDLKVARVPVILSYDTTSPLT